MGTSQVGTEMYVQLAPIRLKPGIGERALLEASDAFQGFVDKRTDARSEWASQTEPLHPAEERRSVDPQHRSCLSPPPLRRLEGKADTVGGRRLERALQRAG